MLTIGNDELGEYLGDTIECPHCGEEHEVKRSKNKDGAMGTLSTFDCGDSSYLCGIDGKSIMHKFREDVR